MSNRVTLILSFCPLSAGDEDIYCPDPTVLAHDKDQLIKEPQQHVTSVTAPYKYLGKVGEGRWNGSVPQYSCHMSPRAAMQGEA